LPAVGYPTFQCLHQHLNKSSQSLQHLPSSGFDTASQLTSARFSLHFAWSLVNYLPPSLLQALSVLHQPLQVSLLTLGNILRSGFNTLP
jgi:hypothetical protein